MLWGRYQERLELGADLALAMTFLNMEGELTPRVLEVTGAPLALKRKEDLALFYLLKAAEFEREKESGAFFHLGLYFLRQDDCEMAEHYFRRHLGSSDGRRGVREAVELLQGDGCPLEVLEEIRSLLSGESSR